MSHHYHPSTLNTPVTPAFPNSLGSTSTPGVEIANAIPSTRNTKLDSNYPVFISHPVPLHVSEEPAVAATSEAAFDPAALTEEDIRAFVQRAINGQTPRTYKINTPPTGRPVRVYADGVCHALSLLRHWFIRSHDRRVRSVPLRVRVFVCHLLLY